jgi:hypothetical protein
MTAWELSTAEEMVDALGGRDAVMALTGVACKHASNWKAFGVLPSKFYLMWAEELQRRGERAPARSGNWLSLLQTPARGKTA